MVVDLLLRRTALPPAAERGVLGGRGEAVRLRDGAGPRLPARPAHHPQVCGRRGGPRPSSRAPGRLVPPPLPHATQAWHLGTQAPAPSQLLSCTDEAPTGRHV